MQTAADGPLRHCRARRHGAGRMRHARRPGRPPLFMLFYRAALPLSSKTLNFTAGIIRRHRKEIGSPWRALEPHQQGLLDPRPDRPRRKGQALLFRQAQAPRGEPAGHRQSPRRRHLGLRRPARLGPRQAGRVDLGVLDELEAAGIAVLADSGYQGSRHAHVPYKKRKGGKILDSEKEANRAHARLRAPGERANAQLKSWNILRKARCCPTTIGKLARAIHVLQLQEAA
jgi:hypothetical protein